jgi:hypothetical protein
MMMMMMMMMMMIRTTNTVVQRRYKTVSFERPNATTYDLTLHVKEKKVKVSRKRPGVAQMVPGGLGSQILLHSAY